MPVSTATASAAPDNQPPGVSLTLTKFEPMQGTPGEGNYRNARLTYRITVSGKNAFDLPAVNFSVESPTGAKLLERRVAPLGGGKLEPGQPVERTISLDPGMDADWGEAYGKTQNANFNWSINGKSSGTIEKPVHKSWP